MFKSLYKVTKLSMAVRPLVQPKIQNLAIIKCFATENHGLPFKPHGQEETDDEFDARYEGYFNDPAIDGWTLRKRMTDMQGMDLIPEPKIIIAALKACRRLNDYSLSVRYLEAVKFKCGNKLQEIWPYLLQEIRPTLNELGISTPEEMGYDKPELSLENPFEE